MTIKPDLIVSSSTIPTYIDLGTTSTTLTISGTVADGAQTPFTAFLTLPSQGNREDVYATNLNTNTKALISGGNYFPLYQPAAGEYVTLASIYGGGVDTITIQITITVNNFFSGGPVTLISQTYTISALQYHLPL